jgi:adenosylhomocysteine nucleosidase
VRDDQLGTRRAEAEPGAHAVEAPAVVVLISAYTEWRVVRAAFADAVVEQTPYGECFVAPVGAGVAPGASGTPVRFVHGGWGKIAAAASTQYAIDRWQPTLLVNLGACGGIAGHVERGTILLVERTVVYDILEQMSDPEAAIASYATDLDLAWLGTPYPHPVERGLLVSADRDLLIEDLPDLRSRYRAVAGDWESGAIAYVARRNGVRCLILRGVSDLVGPAGGEAYGAKHVFVQGTADVLGRLLAALPAWLALAGE